MFLLTINDPSWTEPIVQPVRSVSEEVRYRDVNRPTHRGSEGTGRYLVKERRLRIVHEDGEREFFRMWPEHSYTVELA